MSGWPEGTQKIYHQNGKKEIILPGPTDTNKFDRARLKSEALKAVEEKEKMIEKNIQSSIRKSAMSENQEEVPAQKYYDVRQGQIRKDRSDERKFRERQKEKGAENYEKIWDR